jgi:hypothetical protein
MAANKPVSGHEAQRLAAANESATPWRKWGPYLGERQWGTVREDYSSHGDPWNYFPHDHARSRAYHWGEDGLAGISDDQQRLCFALALWNGNDPILKERLFGLANGEGNHGEDVKECYFYLDSTPTHSYMKCLYKYPQRAYPYTMLVEANRRRSRQEPEFELIDTGAFDDNRYFDVFIEYAKATPEDVLIRITAVNRGSEPAQLHLLPTLWFRNTWWTTPYGPKPALRKLESGCRGIAASHPDLGARWLYVEGAPQLLFTDNETNNERLFGAPNISPYVKDAFDAVVVHGRRDAVNPNETGTKAAAQYDATIAPGASAVFRLRLCAEPPDVLPHPFAHFDETVAARIQEADEFFATVTPPSLTSEAAQTIRQAFAGMLWNKQYYGFDVKKWLEEHGTPVCHPNPLKLRNTNWPHLDASDVVCVPDKWEYPWFAAWDLPFHAVALAGLDQDFAKSQLELMLSERYMHPNGQLPADEWNFSAVTPPLHAWATIMLQRNEQMLRGVTDVEFLKRSFVKLLCHFTWWANRLDRLGKNVFQGGFVGLDALGISARLSVDPAVTPVEHGDGAVWMAVFCQNMLDLAIEITAHDPAFEDQAVKFVDHFVSLAAVINRSGHNALWDEDDGFYYDVLRTPDGHATRLKVRSVMGLLPLCATTLIDAPLRARVPRLEARLHEVLGRVAHARHVVHPVRESQLGHGDRSMLAVVAPQRLRRLLARMLDEREFLSPFGIRTLSRVHRDYPVNLHLGPQEIRVSYRPGESDSAAFGGNSNRRGPVVPPINVMLIRALLQFYAYYGDSFVIECPTGSGHMMNLFDVAKEVALRLSRLFLRDENGRRAVFGNVERLHTDPAFRDYPLFHEYFNGDSGAGLGAGHHTGWTGVVATVLQLFATITASDIREGGAHTAHRLLRVEEEMRQLTPA